jgi:hypothetical protein
MSVPRIERWASSITPHQSSKVGAVCVEALVWFQCGGRSVMIVPTATTVQIRLYSRLFRQTTALRNATHTGDPFQGYDFSSDSCSWALGGNT